MQCRTCGVRVQFAKLFRDIHVIDTNKLVLRCCLFGKAVLESTKMRNSNFPEVVELTFEVFLGFFNTKFLLTSCEWVGVTICIIEERQRRSLRLIFGFLA